jgi:hypothetical protein
VSEQANIALATSGENGNNQIAIPADEIPFSAYQAIYHKLTKKVEKNVKHYNDAYTITLPDVENLNNRIEQLLKQYQVKLNRCEVSHTFKDDQNREHSSFEKFKIADCSIRSCTTKLNYQYDFMVVLPPEISGLPEIAQRYKIDVLFDQDFFEKTDINAPFFMRGMMFGKNITATVEYADYVVFQAICSTIDGWVNTLPKKEPGKFVKFLMDREGVVRQFADTAVRFFGLIGGAVALSANTTIDAGRVGSIILFCFALAFTSYSVVGYAVDKFYKNIYNFIPLTFLSITDGDRDRMDKMIKNRSKSISISLFIVTAIILAASVNIGSSWLYEIIFKAD